MGLWSSILSAVGNAANDIFGGGNNNQNDPLKQKQQQNNTPVVNQKINLPVPLQASGPLNLSAPTPHPVFNNQPLDSNQAGLTASPTVAGTVNLAPQTAAPVQAQPAPHQSLFGSLLHDAGSVAGAVASPFTYFAKNDIIDPTKELAAQATGNTQAYNNATANQNVDLGLSTRNPDGSITGNSLKSGLEKLGGNTAGALLTVAAPGVDSALSSGISRVIPEAAPTLVKTLVPKIASNGIIGGTFNDANAVANGQTNPADLAKSFATGFGVAGATGGLLNSVPAIRNIRLGRDVSPTAETATDLGATAADEPLAPENAPPETGTKGPQEPAPTNAPSSEPSKPVTDPNAPESGVKPTPTPPPITTTPTVPVGEPAPVAPIAPPEAVPTPAPVAAEQAAVQQAVDKTATTPPASTPPPETAAPAISPAQAESEALAAKQAPVQQVVANETPTKLEKTGNAQTDLENAAQAVHDRIESPADFSGNKDAQGVIDQVNGRAQGHDVVAKEFADRLNSVLTKEEQANVQEALQKGTVDQLTGTEKEVAQILQQHLNNPADVLRSATDKEYVSGDNYSTQLRQGGVRSAAKTANNMGGGLKNKISNFNDLLQQSRFSQARTAGKFTSGNSTLYGDPADVGLIAKKDGTFVDEAGKVYNYSHASNQELAANAGMKFHDLGTSSSVYAKDTMSLADRTAAANEMIKNPEKYGLSDTSTERGQPSVTIKGSDGEPHEFFTDKGTQKAMQQAGITTGGVGNKTNLAATLWNKATTGLVQSIVMNPTVHSMNQLVQGVTASGLRANGVGGLSFLKNAINHSVDDVVAFHDAGGYVPTYGKNTPTILSKLTFGGSKLNEKAMSAIDGNFRVSSFKSLVKGGMDPKEAAATVNRFMGDRGVFKDAQPQMGMFMHYFMTMNKSAGSTIAQAFKGHPGALTNAAMAAGATYVLQKAWQDATGNPNASVHAPGMVGIAKDYVASAEDLAKGQFKNAASPILNRINPLVSQGAEQVLGVDNFGNKFKDGSARLDNALSISPVTNALANNGHSLGEKAANTFGLYTPHIKGDMAVSPNSPLSPALNVKGAQNGSTVAFPQDFTGKQEETAYNNSLGTSGATYSTKGAASFANQTQTEQQATTNATKVLKTLGVTNANDIKTFAKLSAGDQQNYQTAAQQVLKSGGSVTSTSVQDQLIKNGHLDQAAAMDTGIPASLSPQDKETLETYARGGNAGQKAVWLQNNDNAAKYYNAVINQRQAQGALTTDDTDMHTAYSGSGGTLYVKAAVAQTNQQNNVPQSLVELYKNTSKTQYEGTSTTGGNVSADQRAQLAQYAAQLNANGVTDKFGVATGTSSGSGSSSTSAAAADRAAGIPTSGTDAITAVAPSGLKEGTVKYTKPTLKAYTAPTAKNGNPFVHTISSTAGVK